MMATTCAHDSSVSVHRNNKNRTVLNSSSIENLSSNTRTILSSPNKYVGLLIGTIPFSVQQKMICFFVRPEVRTRPRRSGQEIDKFLKVALLVIIFCALIKKMTVLYSRGIYYFVMN
jgi:hypothetical protein